MRTLDADYLRLADEIEFESTRMNSRLANSESVHKRNVSSIEQVRSMELSAARQTRDSAMRAARLTRDAQIKTASTFRNEYDRLMNLGSDKKTFRKKMLSFEPQIRIMGQQEIHSALDHCRQCINEIHDATGVHKVLQGKNIEEAIGLLTSVERSIKRFEETIESTFESESLAISRTYDRACQLAESKYKGSLDAEEKRYKAEQSAIRDDGSRIISRIKSNRTYISCTKSESYGTSAYGYVSVSMPRSGNLRIPTFIDPYGRLSILIEDYSSSNEPIRSMVGHILSSYENVPLSLDLADLCRSGLPFSSYTHDIMPIDKTLIGERVVTDYRGLVSMLDSVKSHIDNVTQFKLSPSKGIEDVYKYNSKSNEPVPIRFVFIIMPGSMLTKAALTSLQYITLNGSRCGVHLVLSLTDDDFQKDVNPLELISENVLRLVSKGGSATLIRNGKRRKIILSTVDIESIVMRIVKAIEKRNSRMVNYRSILPNSKNLMTSSAKDGLNIPFGVNGREIVDIRFGYGTANHALITGSTGSGKTALAHTILTSACAKYSPAELELYLLDFKEGVEFSEYGNLKVPHVKVIVQSCSQEFAENILDNLEQELERRGTIFRNLKLRDYQSYRAKGYSLPRILIVADEFQHMFDRSTNGESAERCGNLFERIAREGRSFGMHLMMSTQSISSLSSSSNSSLRGSSFDQLIERVILGYPIPENDAMMLLKDRTKDLEVIDRNRGTGIINYAGGAEPSVKFDVAWIPNEKRESLLSIISSIGKDRGFCPHIDIFDLSETPSLKSAMGFIIHNQGCLLLGKSMRMDPEYVSFKFDGSMGENALTVTSAKNAARILMSISSSFCSKKGNDMAIMNFPPEISNRITASNKMIGVYSGSEETKGQIEGLPNLLNFREKTSNVNGEILLAYWNIASIPDFVPGMGKLDTLQKAMMTALESGPSKGVHIILFFDSFMSFKKTPSKVTEQCGHRIVGPLNSEAYTIAIKKTLKQPPKEGEAVYMNPEGEVQKIRLFGTGVNDGRRTHIG